MADSDELAEQETKTEEQLEHIREAKEHAMQSEEAQKEAEGGTGLFG